MISNVQSLWFRNWQYCKLSLQYFFAIRIYGPNGFCGFVVAQSAQCVSGLPVDVPPTSSNVGVSFMCMINQFHNVIINDSMRHFNWVCYSIKSSFSRTLLWVEMKCGYVEGEQNNFEFALSISNSKPRYGKVRVMAVTWTKLKVRKYKT